jgi:Helix-turn-helix domain
MRRGVGAGFPQNRELRSAQAVPNAAVQTAGSAQARTNISRLFLDLRAALRATPHQVAAHLMVQIETIEALETGHFEFLPPWPETARIVMAYTALVGIDGRPVLAALADVLRASAVVAPPAPANARRLPAHRLLQAGNALAQGAKRLPAGALNQVRQRPERALYAVSLPLAIVLLMLNTSVLHAAISHVPRPVARMAQDVRQFFQEQFAPVREGLRWIEVDDPRRRRGDKLR